MAAADAVEGARTELGALDGAADDGDHGVTMNIAIRNVLRRFEAAPDSSPAGLLRQVDLSMRAVGGAIGPLYAAALSAVAIEVDGHAPGTPLTTALLRRCAEVAENAIRSLGHANPGDKNILDALHPLVDALRDAEASSDVVTAIDQAALAAEVGAAATADMVAKTGRASRIGERSRGQPDAGATSFAMVVRALASAHAEFASRE